MYNCTCIYGTVKKTHQFICITYTYSTGNAYDVISHSRLSGPRAPQYFGQVYAYDHLYSHLSATTTFPLSSFSATTLSPLSSFSAITSSSSSSFSATTTSSPLSSFSATNFSSFRYTSSLLLKDL